MSRFDRVLSWIENGVAGAALAAAAIMAILQVILRTFFEIIIFWSEESVVYLVILSTFVGAVITLRHNEHVGVAIIPTFLKGGGKKAFAFISAVLITIYCAVLGGLGWIMLTEPSSTSVVTPALKLPLWVVQVALPLGLTLMLVRALEIAYRTLRYGKGFPEAEEAEPVEGEL